MFTGLVDGIGTIDRVARTDAGIELRILCKYEDLAVGESIAVNGVCLTVLTAGKGEEARGKGEEGSGKGKAVRGKGEEGSAKRRAAKAEGSAEGPSPFPLPPSPAWFTSAAMITTAGLTTIADWRAARRVNLERALRPADRLGGHFVQGHVDGVARVTRADTVQDALLLELALPPGLAELMVERGSVALDGVSLTVSGLPGADIIQVSIIDHTRRRTTLGDLTVGDTVHVEADILAKHVRKLLSAHVRSSPSNS